MLHSFGDLVAAIKSDLFRYGGLRGMKGLIKAYRIPGFKYTLVLRVASKTKKWSILGIIIHYWLRRLGFKYGFQIPYTTIIGKGFYIGHFGTLVINSKATLGSNCNISPGVTIGQTNRGSKCGAPIIGNKVWIGTNSVIVGHISIGDNVLIAPNSFVNMDIPSNSIVIGNPMKIIANNDATNNYIEHLA